MKITRCNRGILAFFGILDAILLVRCAHQIAWPSLAFSGDYALLAIVLEVSRPVFLLSLAVSATGLMLGRPWALILSYVQFPFRFLFLLLSFGFLTLIPGIARHAHGQQIIIVAAMVLELGRLLVTIAVHRGLTTRCC